MSASCPWSIGTTKWPTRAVADGKPRYAQALEAVRTAFDQHAITQRLAPHVLAEWQAWAIAAGQKPFSAPRRPWKGATAICHKCITISGDYPSSDTRCGPSCITSIVALRMARRQRRAFSGGRFRISLKRCYPISRPCLDLGNANHEVALSH